MTCEQAVPIICISSRVGMLAEGIFCPTCSCSKLNTRLILMKMLLLTVLFLRNVILLPFSIQLTPFILNLLLYLVEIGLVETGWEMAFDRVGSVVARCPRGQLTVPLKCTDVGDGGCLSRWSNTGSFESGM